MSARKQKRKVHLSICVDIDTCVCICRCVHIVKFQVTIGLPNRDVNSEVSKNMNVHLGICVEIDAHAFLYVYCQIPCYHRVAEIGREHCHNTSPRHFLLGCYPMVESGLPDLLLQALSPHSSWRRRRRDGGWPRRLLLESQMKQKTESHSNEDNMK